MSTATFNLLRPLPAFYAQVHSAVTVDTNFNIPGTWLHFGNPASAATAGVVFGYSNAPPISGIYYAIQIVDAYDERQNNRTNASCSGQHYSGVGLDSYDPYAELPNTTVAWSDAPGSQLGPPISWLSRSESFTHFLMFRPDPTNTSIRVPLYKVSWSFSGSARTNGTADQYILLPNSTPTNVPPFDLPVEQTLDFPTWTNNILNVLPTTVSCYDEN